LIRHGRGAIWLASIAGLVAIASLVIWMRFARDSADSVPDAAGSSAPTGRIEPERVEPLPPLESPIDIPPSQRSEMTAGDAAASDAVIPTAGSPLAIYVTRPSGTPVPAAKVRLYPKSLRGPRDLAGFDPVLFKHGRAAATESTNASGEAHFEHGVIPDTIVCVDADGFAPSIGTVTAAEAMAGRSDFVLGNAGSIHAKVVDGLTSRPIVNAIVLASLLVGDLELDADGSDLTFRALTARRSMADFTGRCQLTTLDDQTPWCVWVYAEGYPGRRTFPVHVSAVEQTIRVYGGVPLRGRVVDEEGEGIPGVIVKGSVCGTWPVQDVLIARTHDDGRFDFDAAPPTPLFFLLNKMGYALGVETIAAPGASDVIEFVLRKQVPFSGDIVDDVGRPIAGARIEFTAVERAANPGHFTTYDDGTFDMPWISGEHTYIVDLSASGHTPRRIAGIKPQAGMRFVLDRCGQILGRLSSPAGDPIRKFRAAWLYEVLPVMDQDSQREHLPWREFSTTDGSFALTGVHAGSVELFVDADGFERPEPVRVVVPPGRPSELIALELDQAASISGRIITPEGLPIRGATVSWLYDSMTGMPSGRATPTKCDTDNAGQFTLCGLPDRPFQLRVTDNVHPNALYPELRVEDFPRDLVFSATCRIEGRVHSQWLSPDSAVIVSARPEGSVTWSNVPLEPDGSFRFGDIPAGTWLLSLADFWGSRSAAAQDSRNIRRVVLGPGQIATVDIDLRSRSRIVGFVSGAFSPDEFRRVEASLFEVDGKEPRGDAPVASGSCESDGRFVLHSVPPGRYVVTATTQLRGAGAFGEAMVEIRDEESTAEVTLFLAPPSISGRVADGDDHPVVADVRVVRERDGVTLFSVHTERDGGYRLAPPMGEKFRLLVTAPGFAEQRSGSFDADQAPDEPLEHVLEPEARLVIAVRDDAGGPVAGALVELRDAADRSATTGAPHWQGRSGADGVATATRLPAGAWSVTARHASWPDSPPVVADVEWGETRSVAMTLTRVGQAALRVTDPDGAPKADVVVTLAPVGRAASPRVSASDAHGRVVFERLEAGPWLASCEGAEAIPVAITPGGETTADLIVTGPRR
jgi:hypothetical protein